MFVSGNNIYICIQCIWFLLQFFVLCYVMMITMCTQKTVNEVTSVVRYYQGNSLTGHLYAYLYKPYKKLCGRATSYSSELSNYGKKDQFKESFAIMVYYLPAGIRSGRLHVCSSAL